ncbi:MAG: hypothetical protein DKM50_08355 [Candidatus Margulisiibacteriota bacterium]|nr:MAG: hypothetical protein A2X43_03135 [Candidatus Margulisbacteria bacterium GWD2_39_127]OGI05007.1 MAG: hypothetical protein A2X42_05400 [Candidatus Margulisbacteria bacterium GWF2_38_17]OGI09003.1 MAG: hypothetical protein A2X41_01595 [Candidatus Margulisbacteria bacterium GWE2_39_32]PZM79607.1 MAG: hypothetical protein DKM50_08355 [Candidatus Margulisiibacteriota bacterium]HAR63211.1 hypothetical protein [Candidatus Margulisiibacteriota bacterium]
MKKMYLKEWFTIKFADFTTLDRNNIADNSFYDKFYTSFFSRYLSFQELPWEWREEKREVAEFILQNTQVHTSILSIGCGIGYVEYLLGKVGRDITAIEPSEKACKFLDGYSTTKLFHGYFPQCFSQPTQCNYDLAYMVYVDYVFSDKELLYFLNKIIASGIKDFILIATRRYNRKSYRLLAKELVKDILAACNAYNPGQFWGYLRKPSELICLFHLSGFNKIEHGHLHNGLFWIRGRMA